MKDCKLCTNTTTACNGKKGKIVLKKERRKKNVGPKISLILLERAIFKRYIFTFIMCIEINE